MTTKRIIACLDVDKGRVVKGKKFQNIKEVADPVELAKYYSANLVDELVLYDITASTEERDIFLDVVEMVAKVTTVPFTVGGGIRSVDDIKKVLAAGADKVSINSAAIKDPNFIKEAADAFGSSIIVFAMDAKQIAPNKWTVHAQGGSVDTGIDAVEWAVQGSKLGASEIVVNAIDEDGAKTGYNLELTKKIADSVNVPIVASGGAGTMEHFAEALTKGGADAALAASVFHYDEIQIPALKEYLKKENINVRRGK